MNAAEAAGDVTITGTVGGDAKEGDTVTLTGERQLNRLHRHGEADGHLQHQCTGQRVSCGCGQHHRGEREWHR
ncbi:hypothetical protein [Vibrio gallaecicus]|uniref:hypothetical protein n=1 Tax=Vibrio gallaecicus TaxID=552386 RepID=UPI0025B3F9AC|nr:hypothetical protein [Vibrio gallaecicus]MDN3613991.1 hypothetical protein [Vibrio gallaecicus]